MFHIFSDDSAAQFKNRCNLLNLTVFKEDMRVSGTRSYFATSHGKGAVDGVGVTAKRAVALDRLSRRCIMQNAEDFAKCAETALQSIKVMHLSKSKEMLDER